MAAKAVLVEKLTLQAPHLSAKQWIPAFLYGTAWKKEATTDLVVQALSNGFTGIDTACQPRHYREDLVGEGLRKALAQNSFKRSDIYVQTKFTSIGGQDPNNVPYDPKKPIVEQVKQSIEQSLKNFKTTSTIGSGSEETYLDTVVLHSPMQTIGETMEVWHTLEGYVPGKIRNIGVSNCDLFTLMNIYERANIKPAVVQNRFYPRTKFDIGVRKFCQERNIVYQSFWTLSANPDLLRSAPVQEVASQLQTSKQSALYSLVIGLGNTVVLNGTTSEQHMKEDWATLAAAKEFAVSDPIAWKSYMDKFRKIIGERTAN